MNQNSAFPLVGANTQGNRATTGPAGTAKPSGGKPPGARNYSEFLGSKKRESALEQKIEKLRSVA